MDALHAAGIDGRVHICRGGDRDGLGWRSRGVSAGAPIVVCGGLRRGGHDGVSGWHLRGEGAAAPQLRYIRVGSVGRAMPYVAAVTAETFGLHARCGEALRRPRPVTLASRFPRL